ncbi:MAG: hypothetical protein O3C40_01880 [Planctomycetota bacterium]|nr:hypothetical protein [Planctomycetota bacterium]
MIRTSVYCFAFAIIAALNVPVAAQEDDESKAAERQRHLAIMSKLIDEIRMFESVDGEDVELTHGEQPVTHFDDNVRRHVDATLWAFTRNGRPVALITCATRDASTRRWSHAVASLSTNLLRAEQSGRSVWRPQQPGVEYRPLPDARPPDSTSSRRRLQLRELARRFNAHEFWNPDNQRFELRLSPRPVLVHSDESAGVLDGGVFLFAHGVNPEVAVMIEAVGGEEAPSWRYAIAKLGSAEFHVALDGEEVYQSPRAPGVVGRPVDPYFLFPSMADE